MSKGWQLSQIRSQSPLRATSIVARYASDRMEEHDGTFDLRLTELRSFFSQHSLVSEVMINVRFGFAARCAAVALPRRRVLFTVWAMPWVWPWPSKPSR